MPMPVAGQPRTNPSETLLLSSHVNVKAFGGVGDGVADDTTAINNAITAATAASMTGPAQIVFPTGTYKITTTITLPNGRNIRFSGGGPGLALDEGTMIRGNLATSLITKTGSTNSQLTFENIAFQNDHATGTCVSLTFLEAPSGFYRCAFYGHRGVSLPSEDFDVVIDSCQFRLHATTFAGSWGIQGHNHTEIRNVDINGFYEGIRLAGVGLSVIGCRIERCFMGINLGVDDTGAISVVQYVSVAGINFEACDTAIALTEASRVLISACGMFGNNNAGCPGSTGLPSGSGTAEQEVVKVIHSIEQITLVGVGGGGTFANGVWNHTGFGGSMAQVTLMNCNGPWGTLDPTFEIINCQGSVDQRHIPVIARASLPAAAAAQDGRLIIDDNGAGDRNLMLYAGGQRFRIDGGANV